MTIRTMTAADAQDVAALSGQLGYPMTPTRVRQRLEMITRRRDNGVFVAEQGGAIVGWIHVYGVHLLESESYTEVGGLVVDEQTRRRGIGRALMAKAEEWAQSGGYPDIRLRSSLPRTEAHQFYQRIGYTLTKTSHMFRKVLDCPT